MSYVPIRGGEDAIGQAARALESLRTSLNSDPLSLQQIEGQLHFLVSRLLSEGGLYDPALAALAVKQTAGDLLEASFLLRAYRSTRPRLDAAPRLLRDRARLIRRISAAFKDVPGGQHLGPTLDYAVRLFRFDLMNESPEQFRAAAARLLEGITANEVPDTFGGVLERLREEGLLPPVTVGRLEPIDITRQALSFPAPRSAALMAMSRAETGALLALAYSNMRGYGDIHPTVAELRVGYLPVDLPHPVTGEPGEAGEVLVTECEVISMYEPSADDGRHYFTLGYGACFGHNEVKAISMAVLDRSLQIGRARGPSNPSEDEEFVLLHIDGVESAGFCTHYKMPHYVTFTSDMDRLRATQARSGIEV